MICHYWLTLSVFTPVIPSSFTEYDMPLLVKAYHMRICDLGSIIKHFLTQPITFSPALVVYGLVCVSHSKEGSAGVGLGCD